MYEFLQSLQAMFFQSMYFQHSCSLFILFNFCNLAFFCFTFSAFLAVFAFHAFVRSLQFFCATSTFFAVFALLPSFPIPTFVIYFAFLPSLQSWLSSQPLESLHFLKISHFLNCLQAMLCSKYVSFQHFCILSIF